MGCSHPGFHSIQTFLTFSVKSSWTPLGLITFLTWLASERSYLHTHTSCKALYTKVTDSERTNITFSLQAVTNMTCLVRTVGIALACEPSAHFGLFSGRPAAGSHSGGSRLPAAANRCLRRRSTVTPSSSFPTSPSFPTDAEHQNPKASFCGVKSVSSLSHLPGEKHSSGLKSWGFTPMSRTWGLVRDSASLEEQRKADGSSVTPTLYNTLLWMYRHKNRLYLEGSDWIDVNMKWFHLIQLYAK